MIEANNLFSYLQGKTCSFSMKNIFRLSLFNENQEKIYLYSFEERKYAFQKSTGILTHSPTHRWPNTSFRKWTNAFRTPFVLSFRRKVDGLVLFANFSCEKGYSNFPPPKSFETLQRALRTEKTIKVGVRWRSCAQMQLLRSTFCMKHGIPVFLFERNF